MSYDAPNSDKDKTLKELLSIARHLQAEEPPAEELKPDYTALDVQDRQQDIKLKREYASWLKWLLIIQLAFADGIMALYAQFGVNWDIPDVVISTWLGATVVEIIGIVLVVTRYLFPNRDSAKSD